MSRGLPMNTEVFVRLCYERGFSPTEAAAEIGIGSSTLAKILKGLPVSLAVHERAATWFENTAVRPRLAELLAVAS